MPSSFPRALTIAGSDSGGGAGIQADLKTFSAFGVYGASAITALTVQNTLGVHRAQTLDPSFVRDQVDAVVSDIGADAAKTGMLAAAPIVRAVAESIRSNGLRALVVDPVMAAKGGHALIDDAAVKAVRESLLPLALVVTPNIPEAERLTGLKITDIDGMEAAARALHEMGAEYAVVKGGHLPEASPKAHWPEAVDVVFDGKEFTFHRARRIATRNTHGTGCTFSAAIAAGLALGMTPLQAISEAKRYISLAIERAVPLGAGHGPTNHLVPFTPAQPAERAEAAP